MVVVICNNCKVPKFSVMVICTQVLELNEFHFGILNLCYLNMPLVAQDL